MAGLTAEARPTEGRRRRAPYKALAAATLVVVAAVCGVLLWLAITAPDTVARLQALAEPSLPSVVAALPPRPNPSSPSSDAEAARQADEVMASAPPPLPQDDAEPGSTPPTDSGNAEGGSPTADAPVEDEGPRVPWRDYARPFDQRDDRPRIAVVIGDLGLRAGDTSRVIDTLPPDVTLAFNPHAEDLATWLSLARAGGHESLIMLPMEPESFPLDDPGPWALLTSLDPEENSDRLDWTLRQADGVVGAISMMGSRFTSDWQALRPVLVELRDRGLMFVDNATSPNTVVADIAYDIELPAAFGDRVLDDVASRDAIARRLSELEEMARDRGYAVGLGAPYPMTIESLAVWIPTLSGKGLVLAPITAVAEASW